MSAPQESAGAGFVFIVGTARTGSKIYLTTLNRHSDIDLVNELHYLAPRYVRRDFAATVRQRLGRPLGRVGASELVTLMFSGAANGTFWERKPPTGELQQRIGDLDPEVLAARLGPEPATPRQVLRVLLQEHARVAGKARPGAKFPVDIGRVEVLMRWFPDAAFVHLVRDPRAILASMLAREPGSGRRRAAAVPKRLGYVVLQYRRAAQLHRRWQGTAAYYLSRFEDMVGDPGRSIPALCRFLGLEATPEMFLPPGRDSSFRADSAAGLDATAVAAWRDHLGNAERRTVEVLLRREMALFGYAADQRAPASEALHGG